MKKAILLIFTSFGITQHSKGKQNITVPNGNDTLNVTVYSKPDAETVILLHGGPGVPDDMVEVAKLLHQKYQVVYFEQRGTGSSICATHSYSVDSYLSDIQRIASHLSLQKFHLFGHSWGGLYAQLFAQKHANQVLSLFLCSPSSGTGEDWKKTEKEVLDYVKSKTTHSEFIKMGWYSLMGKLGRDKAYQKLFHLVLEAYHSGYAINNLSLNQLAGVRSKPINKTRKALVALPPLEIQKDTLFPVCITYGSDDIYGNSREYVFKRFPLAEIQTIDAAGHIPWKHNLPLFKAICTKFYQL